MFGKGPLLAFIKPHRAGYSAGPELLTYAVGATEWCEQTRRSTLLRSWNTRASEGLWLRARHHSRVKTAIPLRADCSQIALDERADGSWVIMFLGVESVAEDCARGTCQARTSYTALDGGFARAGITRHTALVRTNRIWNPSCESGVWRGKQSMTSLAATARYPSACGR